MLSRYLISHVEYVPAAVIYLDYSCKAPCETLNAGHDEGSDDISMNTLVEQDTYHTGECCSCINQNEYFSTAHVFVQSGLESN